MSFERKFEFHFRRFSVVALLTIGLPAQAATQGAIGGRVFDPQGAVVAHAKMTLVGRDGNPVSSMETGADGSFQFRNLNSGWYQVRVQASGFVQPNPSRVFV